MRAVLVLVLAVLALASGLPRFRSSKPTLDGRIVGGISVSIEEFPYTLSYMFLGSHVCGGSIISIRVGLTAAHCTDGANVNILSVRAGSSLLNAGGTVVSINSFIQHPQYDSWLIDFDLSILFFDQTLNFGPTISAVGLPYQGQEIAGGTNSTTAGWGHLYQGSGVLSPDLQAVNVPIVSLENCREAYGTEWVTDQMICAGVPEGGLDACQGDSGGPLVVPWSGGPILVGATSWGYGCAQPGFPGVYARVAAFRSFIASEAWV